jgi:hypothetical protein
MAPDLSIGYNILTLNYIFLNRLAKSSVRLMTLSCNHEHFSRCVASRPI